LNGRRWRIAVVEPCKFNAEKPTFKMLSSRCPDRIKFSLNHLRAVPPSLSANRAFAEENVNGEHRINACVSTSAYLALGWLAQRYGVTNKEMLEKLIAAEDKNITSSLDPNGTEWEEYFSITH